MLLSLDTPDKIAANALLDRHKALTAPLQQAESSGGAAPVSSSLESSIEELASTAREMQELFQRRRAMLASIRNAATTSSQENLPSFSIALETYRAELAAEQQERIDGQLAEARAESEAALLQVEQEAEAALAEAKRRAAEIRGQVETDRIASEAQTRSGCTGDRECENGPTSGAPRSWRWNLSRTFPRLSTIFPRSLRPVTITLSRKPPLNRHPSHYRTWSQLERLHKTDDGLRRLCGLASYDVGDRPRGPLPHVGTSLDWLKASQQNLETVTTAQGLLRKYGLLMVEKKMLLP